jgi:hypothetical protein
VRFVEADLFTWEPDRRYDVVFMGFWLSHVPAERFESFWALVAAALAPRGRMFFSMTVTARQRSSSRARRLPSSSGAPLTGRPTGS